MVCEAWALQGYGTPPGVFAFYALKLAIYIGAWVYFCSFSPSLGGPSTIATWALSSVAFQKAITWSLLFEVLGFGCGSGPLSGRYLPPVGGFLYFLRRNTTKLPLFPGAPIIGAPTRSLLDVALYLALVVASIRALVAPLPDASHFAPIIVLLAALGVLDKTIFLAARAEHYWVTLVCFVASPLHWIAGAKAVQLALWFWAGVSKLNHHFPTVVCVMTSNGPLTRFPALRRRMYRAYPHDLRPSRLATLMGHAGTALELTVPLAFLLTPLGTSPVVAVLLMLALHAYITSHVPMGVPIEWNFLVVYGALALFWAHPDVSVLSVGLSPRGLPRRLPRRASSRKPLPVARVVLLAMRYYAGNWAWSIWLFAVSPTASSRSSPSTHPWVCDQLARFCDRATAVGLVGKVMGFRMMHLHGRAATPRAAAPSTASKTTMARR